MKDRVLIENKGSVLHQGYEGQEIERKQGKCPSRGYEGQEIERKQGKCPSSGL
ncbi:hypothetical protein NSQ59_18645 [Margalitia sp. FSL K6-0131]|uniref:hypothetical protein n=1 Tax=Margalitia sp. FSL K6-0131 TaxID=2954604 RepID=UPI0030FD1003